MEHTVPAGKRRTEGRLRQGSGSYTVKDRFQTARYRAGRIQGKRRIFAGSVLWALALSLLAQPAFLAGCGRADRRERFSSQYYDLFDTVTVFTAYADSKETFDRYADIMYHEMLYYHQLYDIYHEYEGVPNFMTVNRRAGAEPVTVDEKILALLEKGVELYDLTGGSVNIAMGSVLSVWHDYREAGIADPDHAQLPPPELLREAAEHTDIRKVRIDRENSSVFLEDPQMSLDVGAIAKGFAAEMVCERLEEEGMDSGMLNVGGNVRAIGTKPDGEAWMVGIQNPLEDGGEAYLHRIGLDDMALVTSGTYQRFYTVAGVRYHHIIHPETLMPRDTYASVSVLCADSGLADGLSTAFFNMEYEDGLELAERLDGVEVLWIYPDGTEKCSSGFQNMISEK